MEIKTPDQKRVKAKALPPMTASVPTLNRRNDKMGMKLVKRKTEAKVCESSCDEFRISVAKMKGDTYGHERLSLSHVEVSFKRRLDHILVRSA